MPLHNPSHPRSSPIVLANTRQLKVCQTKHPIIFCSTSWHVLLDFDPELQNRSLKHPQYISAFKVSADQVPQLQYSTFKFTQISCISTDDGGVQDIASNDSEVVMITCDWHQWCKSFQGPKEGYLGKGMTKVAFQVCVQRMNSNLKDAAYIL